MKIELRGRVAKDEVRDGLVRVLALGAGGGVGLGGLVELVRGGQPLMDKPKNEELLVGGEAVDGSAVSSPVDGVDGVCCPVVVFSNKVLAEAAGSKYAAEVFR